MGGALAGARLREGSLGRAPPQAAPPADAHPPTARLACGQEPFLRDSSPAEHSPPRLDFPPRAPLSGDWSAYRFDRCGPPADGLLHEGPPAGLLPGSASLPEGLRATAPPGGSRRANWVVRRAASVGVPTENASLSGTSLRNGSVPDDLVQNAFPAKVPGQKGSLRGATLRNGLLAKALDQNRSLLGAALPSGRPAEPPDRKGLLPGVALQSGFPARTLGRKGPPLAGSLRSR